jgi:hypothetical protein
LHLVQRWFKPFKQALSRLGRDHAARGAVEQPYTEAKALGVRHRENLAAGELTLSPQTLAELDRIAS